MARVSADVDHLLECPVCFEIMVEPKLLYCGHSVCGSCMDNLTVGGVGSDVECPKCGQPSQVPHNGFPTNIQLSAIIDHHILEKNKQSHKCMMCDKMNALDDMTMCHSCGDMSLCLRCAFRSHEGHEREELQNHMATMSLSDDDDVFFDALPPPMTQTGILLSDGQYFEFYSPHTNSSRLIDIEMEKRDGFVMEVLSDGRVMVAGGRYHSSEQPAPALIIDLVSKQVMQGPPSTPKRLFASSAMIGGEIYVCGGVDQDYNPLSSCLVYRDGQWIPIADMKVARWGLAVVVLDGLLYAIGGYNYRSKRVDSVECYRPDTNSWEPVSPLDLPRVNFSAAAFNGCIYAAGGAKLLRVESYHRICERYCPSEEQWETVAPMNKLSQFDTLAALGDKLYSLGGPGDNRVESYEPEKNGWKFEGITLKTPCEKAVVLDYIPN